MANAKSKDEKTTDVPKKYMVKGTDFKFKGTRYAEGSKVEMTDEEFNREKGKLTLVPVKG